MAAARYARYREDAILEHTRRTAGALMDLLRSRPFDRLLLAGSTEATARLREELPRPLRARLVGETTLATSAGDDEVLRVAAAAAETAAEGTRGTASAGIAWTTSVDVVVEGDVAAALVAAAEGRGAGVRAGSGRGAGAFGAGSSKPGGSSDSGAFCASAQPEVRARAVPSRR